MIKVQSITIKDFRGIRDLDIDFKEKNFAVCGPNGTGKSGIVDALEFALTGNISRLSGEGTGTISIKEHAPHVDSRNHPDKAKVILKILIPSLKKEVVLERSVQDASTPKISPSSPEILKVLNQIALHPEFALSRRELIKYIVSTPGSRAKQVQALLRLDEIENLRTIFQKISNACKKEVAPLKSEKVNASDQFLRSVNLTQYDEKKLLESVNNQRSLLGLNPIKSFAATTSLKDGLDTSSLPIQHATIPKVQALADVKKFHEIVAEFSSVENIARKNTAVEKISELNSDPLILESINRESFLKKSLELVDTQACPVCDTPWDMEELKKIISLKLKRYEEISIKKALLEKEAGYFADLIDDLQSTLDTIEKYGTTLKSKIDILPISNYKTEIKTKSINIRAFVPLTETILSLENLLEIPKDVRQVVTTIKEGIESIPDPTKRDAARDFLIVSQERLETYRGISSRFQKAEAKATLAKKISDMYARVSNDTLDNIYKMVENDFSVLYSFIHKDDESGFSAQLKPSNGKLNFDVDFYGRGFFPPGAYHSEGHQDGMGICLYLALMKHQLGDSFLFAVLDDVLMSVDSGHRREVCSLLKEKFPNTQFILTTHDPIWLKHMQTAGLISSTSLLHFKKWDVDHGPTEWNYHDVWSEIKTELEKNNVEEASGKLRRYLEYISTEMCDNLRARVEFRGDAQYDLGGLLPNAIGTFKSLLSRGRDVAQKWNQKEIEKEIAEIEKDFSAKVTVSNAEHWQINTAVHYNEWATLQSSDFQKVVDVFQDLIKSFQCQNCSDFFHVNFNKNKPENLRCSCGKTNINLIRKEE